MANGGVSKASYIQVCRSISLNLTLSIYDQQIQNIIISNYVNAVFEDKSPMYIPELLVTFAGILKHEAFSEEKEWRLLCKCNFVNNNYVNPFNPMEYRDSTRGIVPFFRWHFCKEKGYMFDMPITHITLGPQNDTLEEDMYSFLASVGLKDVTVSKSTIPYRN